VLDPEPPDPYETYEFDPRDDDRPTAPPTVRERAVGLSVWCLRLLILAVVVAGIYLAITTGSAGTH
jgi:hypothetical protein